MRIAKSKNRMHECPRGSDGQKGEPEMRGEMPVGFALVCPEEESDRKQSGARCDDDEEKNKRAAQVLTLRAETEPFARRGENGEPRQQQNGSREDVPGCEQL